MTLPVKPLNTTKQVTDYLFFPHVTDPKSWLLKHGSVFVGYNDGAVSSSIDKERDLLLLTHGFCVIDVSLEDVFRLFFALSDQEYLTKTTFMDYVRIKLNLNQEGYNIEEEKIYECFRDLNVPKPKNLVSVLLEKGGVHSPKEFQESLQRFLANGRLPNTASEGPVNFTKVERAKLFTSVAQVDSLSISHNDGSLRMQQTDFSLSVTFFEDTDKPFFFTFATPEDRESWLNKIGERVISAWEDSSDAQIAKNANQIGVAALSCALFTHNICDLERPQGFREMLEQDSRRSECTRSLQRVFAFALCNYTQSTKMCRGSSKEWRCSKITRQKWIATDDTW